jgi:hypothetical protein
VRRMAHEREQTVPEEVRFVARLAGYGLLITVVYWFVSYDVVGTVLLLGFGLAAGFATTLLLLDVRKKRRGPLPRRPSDWIALAADDDDPPFADEPTSVPRGSSAPLEFGFGAALIALGLVFGAWLVALGLVPIVVGASTWLRAAMAEHRIAARTAAEEPRQL